MSVWFSASFVVPQLTSLWNLTSGEASLLTITVQIGFVIGALVIAGTGLADAIAPRTLMASGAAGAAVVNVALIWSPGLAVALPLRFLTGAFLACVYTPALKEVSTWFRTGRGTALGLVIGALTVGSALPHMVNAFGGFDWQLVIAVTSILTAAGGALVRLAGKSGPFPFPKSSFRVSDALRAVRNRQVVLANIGYAGHMWELYAMWAWVGAFLAGVPALSGLRDRQPIASLIAFAAIGAGAAGCLVAGRLSDRWGRAPTTAVCMACSGSAAIAVGFARTGPLWLIVLICVFWGFWVIADSAQFSALVTEHASASYVGSAVSLQLALGYLVTNATLWLVPFLARTASWTVAMAVLAVGPAVGVVAMLQLRKHSAANTAG